MFQTSFIWCFEFYSVLKFEHNREPFTTSGPGFNFIFDFMSVILICKFHEDSGRGEKAIPARRSNMGITALKVD